MLSGRCGARDHSICSNVYMSTLPPSTDHHSQGIGDSAQGFANAVLFVCFTKAVREAFLQSVTCKSCRKYRQRCLSPKPLCVAPFADSQISGEGNGAFPTPPSICRNLQDIPPPPLFYRFQYQQWECTC